MICGGMAEDVAEDGEVVVHHLDGHNTNVTDLEFTMLLYLVQLDGGHARIAVLGKTVGQHLEHALTGYGVGVDVDFAKLTVWAYVVHASHVVVVGMGDEDAVDASEGLRHNLLSKVRTYVDEQACRRRLEQCRAAQPFVVCIGAGACMALAAYGWHAARCTCSEKSKFHRI